MNPNCSHIYDRFVGGQSPKEFMLVGNNIPAAVAAHIRDMPAEWTEDEDMEEVADALVAYITDALTVTVSYAYVDSETRTERTGTWTGLWFTAIDAAIQYLECDLDYEYGAVSVRYYADELGQHVVVYDGDLVELGAGLIAGDADVYSLWAQRL